MTKTVEKEVKQQVRLGFIHSDWNDPTSGRRSFSLVYSEERSVVLDCQESSTNSNLAQWQGEALVYILYG